MENIRIILTDIDVLLKRKENINSFLTLINEGKSFNSQHIDNLIDEQKKYLGPFNLKWQNASSFLDSVLQFIFPFFVKLGLIGKTGFYTEIISRMLTEPDINRKSGIKQEFLENYIPELYPSYEKWKQGDAGKINTLFINIIEQFLIENINIENKIKLISESNNSQLNYSKNYIEHIVFPEMKINNVYGELLANFFIDYERTNIKIIFPTFLFIIIMIDTFDITIPKIMNFSKFNYNLLGVCCHCQTYTKRNGKWYFIRDCNTDNGPNTILNESQYKFFENNNLLLSNKPYEFPSLICYESSTDNQNDMIFDTEKTSDYEKIKNMFNIMNVK